MQLGTFGIFLIGRANLPISSRKLPYLSCLVKSVSLFPWLYLEFSLIGDLDSSLALEDCGMNFDITSSKLTDQQTGLFK